MYHNFIKQNADRDHDENTMNDKNFNSNDLISEYMKAPLDDYGQFDDAGLEVINKYDPTSKKVSVTRENAFLEIATQFMDIVDYDTNKRLGALDESEQNSVLLSITGKLYEMIVDKVDEIDFGDIPKTKGDITKLPKYYQLMECIELMKKLFIQYREDPKAVQEIENAVQYLEDDRALYQSCYAAGIGIGISMYNTMTLACIASVSYMIATCIEYVKDPTSKGMKVALDRASIAKVKDQLLYENLIKFNDSCRKGEVENCLRPLIKNKAKNFTITSALVFASIAIGTIALIMASLTMIRDCVYFFYATRARMSKYLDIQADLLEMNAEELKMNDDIHTEGDKQQVIKRQLAVADQFRKLADMLAIESKKSERMATNEIRRDSKKYKIDDVETDPGMQKDGPLF